jgi:hypothetical protein
LCAGVKVAASTSRPLIVTQRVWLRIKALSLDEAQQMQATPLAAALQSAPAGVPATSKPCLSL